MTEELTVAVPEEQYQIVEFRKDDLPGVGVINSALVGFELREVFRWHLSVVVTLDGLIENGMPSQAERDLVDAFGDQLDERLKASDDQPNSLFLARMTWNATRRLIYRVHDPKAANTLLQGITEAREYAREFNFQIDDDPEWKLADWYLRTALGR